MGYNSNLTNEQNAALNNIHKDKSYVIGQVLRALGYAGVILSIGILIYSGSLFFGLIMLVAMSHYILPIIPFFLILFGQLLIQHSKKKF